MLITAGGNVQVAGCFIGTDPTGETAAPNGAGVVLENSFNLIGGPNVGDRNVLSGAEGLTVQYWQNAGVYVPDQASNPLNIAPTGNVIENNIIGLDATGTKAIENHSSGVYDSGSGNTYGGTTAGLGNVISGNYDGGLNTSGNVTIEGNYIGTDVTGNVAIGNGLGGTGIFGAESASATSISMTISNNVVSGNYDGITLFQTVGESVVLHDLQQSDRNRRLRHGGDREQGFRARSHFGRERHSTEQCHFGQPDRCQDADDYAQRRAATRRVPGEPDRHGQDGPGCHWAIRTRGSISSPAPASRSGGRARGRET